MLQKPRRTDINRQLHTPSELTISASIYKGLVFIVCAVSIIW